MQFDRRPHNSQTAHDNSPYGKALCCIAAFVTLVLIGHLVLLLWAQHDFTPVEALVVLHSNMLFHGEGLYWGVNRYPFTISPYGPIFYAASGFLHNLGVPAYQSARILSYTALLASLWLCWRALGYLPLGAQIRSSRVTARLVSANSRSSGSWDLGMAWSCSGACL